MLPTAVAEALPALLSLPSPSHPTAGWGHQAALCHPALQWETKAGSGAGGPGAVSHRCRVQLATMKPWQHLHSCPSGVSPPAHLQASQWLLGWARKGQGSPQGACQHPQPQGQPGPATSLPGTKRGIEGHSRALSTPCPLGRGRLPSAGFPSPVQGAPKGAGSICCSPGAILVTWGPHGCAHPSTIPP